MIPPDAIPDVFASLYFVYLPIILISAWMIGLLICYKSQAFVFGLRRRIPNKPNQYPDFEMDLNRDHSEITQEHDS